ncbi:hypothetical protein BOTBODRAFT_185562 [Botryobasidium botryosum FD-172 SS1]|uniref:Uncharacterized protein n=1 Tax=Botryobasidium botryosum (strain FD-172 SS1) TaxID=930990 RepID=A0A067MU15_BOTB1|nr:hypothetical protein BOTBODRAFT_185562 [Botryobasidium botryosum FD-172 SS1]
MEKVHGISLADRRREMQSMFTDFERQFSRLRFSQIRRLYFKEDIEPHQRGVARPLFLRISFPRLFAYKHGRVDGKTKSDPAPPNFKDLPAEEQADIKLQFNLAARHVPYFAAVK